MGNLKLKPEQCSPLGQLVLDYIEHTPTLTLNVLAKELEMSRPGLGCACLRCTTPDEQTALKLARLLNLEDQEVARLIYENKLNNLPSAVYLLDAVASLTVVFEAYLKLERFTPTPISVYQVYQNAFGYIESRCSMLSQ